MILAKDRIAGYFEDHHIIPNCFEKNKNTVRLTAREHLICHQLLSRMCCGYKKYQMVCALHYLATNNKTGQQLTSRAFATMRENFSKAMSIIMKGKARKQSPEERTARSKNQLGRVFITNHQR